MKILKLLTASAASSPLITKPPRRLRPRHHPTNSRLPRAGSPCARVHDTLILGLFWPYISHGSLSAPRAYTLSAFPNPLVSEHLKPGAVPEPSASPLWAHLTTMILCAAAGFGLSAFVGCSLRYPFLQKASPPVFKCAFTGPGTVCWLRGIKLFGSKSHLFPYRAIDRLVRGIQSSSHTSCAASVYKWMLRKKRGNALWLQPLLTDKYEYIMTHFASQDYKTVCLAIVCNFLYIVCLSSAQSGLRRFVAFKHHRHMILLK
ncbi:hypothetical protein EDB92DRAFT_1386107 [Lactarius akahatsu]|uniref:Uncharacterized protein n=1 Tax=Lactarius akahatsu TaxID=416441 RepID=A0AAD4QAD1_9AGAM|nr:hypothetical protein EDB92DRAFT_1386107 [Lactarius akahatsu]